MSIEILNCPLTNSVVQDLYSGVLEIVTDYIIVIDTMYGEKDLL